MMTCMFVFFITRALFRTVWETIAALTKTSTTELEGYLCNKRTKDSPSNES